MPPRLSTARARPRKLIANAVIGCALLGCGGPLLAWAPGTAAPTAVQGFSVNRASRVDVLSYYNCVYRASNNYASDLAWTGNVAQGIAGTTAATFKNDVLRRINFYRGLAGWPADIALDPLKSSGCQSAAMMFSANNNIQHTGLSGWKWYTASGGEAAANSNLSLGHYGPPAIDDYMRDDGIGNEPAGHRRWLLYSRATSMGTGDIPASLSFSSTNVTWVIGAFKTPPAPQASAWPSAGYFPFPLMPARWSFSYPGADFSHATVTMTKSGISIPLSIISNTLTGMGDNTLIWVPGGLPRSIASDTTYSITVSGISGSGVPSTQTYAVKLFDPNVLGQSATISGTSAPTVAGASYSFNPIAQADSYLLNVFRTSTAAWSEGAEDSPVPRIIANTTGSYPLRQSALHNAGAKAFHLAFPDFATQSFQLTREIVPSSTSQLQFSELCRFATNTTTLSAEISSDNGSTWTAVWSRHGVGLDSYSWDTTFNQRSVSLAAFAGRAISIRFVLRTNGGSTLISDSTEDGFFIDSITVSNSTQTIATKTTTLPGTATRFTLNATTAGASLVANTKYWLRIRPNVGTRWFGYGPIKTVVPTP